MTDASRRLNAAEIQFKKPQRAGSKKAVAEYETNAVAIGKKTERLKELRLARDAAEAAAKPAAKARKKPAKKAPAPKTDESTATLTGWWKDQREGGRRN